MLQDGHGVLVVQERVQPVAHGVLHGEQSLDGPHGLRIAPHAVPQPEQALEQVGLSGPQLLTSIRGGGVQHRAGGQHEHHGLQGAVRVELGAARHPGGIVGHHSAQRARGLAGRIRAQRPPVRSQPRIDLAHGDPGLHAHAGTPIQDLHALEVAADVHEDLVRDGLPRQGRAARAQGQASVRVRGRGEDPPHLVRVPRAQHRAGLHQVVGGVVSHRAPLQLPGDDDAAAALPLDPRHRAVQRRVAGSRGGVVGSARGEGESNRCHGKNLSP